MPVIPAFENTIAVPSPVGPALANPNAAAATGDAIAVAGARVANAVGDWNEMYVQARRQADAADRLASASKQLEDSQFNWSKHPDRAEATAGFETDAQRIHDQALAGTNDPLVQSYLTRNLAQETIARRGAVQAQSFDLESSARRGDLDTRLLQYAQSAATAGNPLIRAQMVDNANADIDGSVAAGWLKPEDGARRKLTLQSQIAEVAVKQMILSNPGQAAAILGDPAKAAEMFPGLLPEHAENLAMRAENRAYRMESRAQAAQAHADAMAARDLRQQQADVELNLLMQIRQTGKPIDNDTLQNLIDTHQISPEGFRAMESRERLAANTDQAAYALPLWRQVEDGTATPDAIMAAATNGWIKTETAINMQREISRRAREGDNQDQRTAHEYLMRGLSAAQVERGMLGNAGENAVQAQRITEALNQFYDRVSKGEAAWSVARDLVPRYQPPIPDSTILEIPKFGRPETMQQWNAIAAQTATANLPPAERDRQGQLLLQYKSILQRQADAAAARAQQSAQQPGRRGTTGPATLQPSTGGLAPAGSE